VECGEYGAILQLPLGRDTIHDDGSLWHTMILPVSRYCSNPDCRRYVPITGS
jgi:hypothetical protein